MSTTSLHPETLVLHAGNYRSDSATNAVAVPIYQTTSYQFDSTEHAGNLFGLRELGNIYTRIMNPTNAVLEERVAALEGGMVALAVASGSAAVALSLQNLCSAGDNIVSSPHLYGGTWNLFANTFKQLGIEVRFADADNPESFRDLTDDKTRAYFAETLPNPKLNIFPIAEVAAIGKSLDIPLTVDNTAAPITCRPIDHGASIVVHSLTNILVVMAHRLAASSLIAGNSTGSKIRTGTPYSTPPTQAITARYGEVLFLKRLERPLPMPFGRVSCCCVI